MGEEGKYSSEDERKQKLTLWKINDEECKIWDYDMFHPQFRG